MRARGRPRLTAEVLQARVAEYCRRYGVSPSAGGLPPFPSGKRETPQHREWLLVYKAHQRLSRRQQGRCERCDAPAADGSIYCGAHRGNSAADDTRLQADEVAEAGAETRSRAAARGSCPVCGGPVDAGSGVRHTVSATRRRLLLHEPCRQLVSLAERAGPEQVRRVLSCLWPDRRGQRER
jgi:hypothetical protein